MLAIKPIFSARKRNFAVNVNVILKQNISRHNIIESRKEEKSKAKVENKGDGGESS